MALQPELMLPEKVEVPNIPGYAECRADYDRLILEHRNAELVLFGCMGLKVAPVASDNERSVKTSSWHFRTIPAEAGPPGTTGKATPPLPLAYEWSVYTNNQGRIESTGQGDDQVIICETHVLHRLPENAVGIPGQDILYFNSATIGYIAFANAKASKGLKRSQIRPEAFEVLQTDVIDALTIAARQEVLKKLLPEFREQCKTVTGDDPSGMLIDLLYKNPDTDEEALEVLVAGFSPAGIEKFLKLFRINANALSGILDRTSSGDRFRWMAERLSQIHSDLRQEVGRAVNFGFRKAFEEKMQVERQKVQRLKGLIDQLAAMPPRNDRAPVKGVLPEELKSLQLPSRQG